jgi:hypothetical protein
MKRTKGWMQWAAALLALAVLAGAAGAGRQGPAAPVIGPASWADSLDDASGLSWLENSQWGSGQVTLSAMQPLSGDVGSIRTLAEGPDGAFYMGTAGARLWRYDPASGATTDLGTPVPAECDN